MHLNAKLNSEYALVKDMAGVPSGASGAQVVAPTGASADPAAAAAAAAAAAPLMLQDSRTKPTTAAERLAGPPSTAVVSAAGAGASKGTHIMPRRNLARDIPKPEWHAPWKMMRVISGHLGWVRCIAVDPTNDWFVTGSADRTIKVWDLASGTLRLTLTGHISTVRGLAVSSRSPYLFSCGEDKMVKCWDLEYALPSPPALPWSALSSYLKCWDLETHIFLPCTAVGAYLHCCLEPLLAAAPTPPPATTLRPPHALIPPSTLTGTIRSYATITATSLVSTLSRYTQPSTCSSPAGATRSRACGTSAPRTTSTS